jgi:hypothetical protein
MAYTMTSKTTKAASTPWFNQANAASAQRYADFVSNHSGVLEVTGAAVSDTEWNSTMVFENKAAFDAFFEDCKKNSDWAARKAYNTANSIVTEFTYA